MAAGRPAGRPWTLRGTWSESAHSKAHPGRVATDRYDATWTRTATRTISGRNGDPNDIGPDDPAPRASEGPSHTTVDGYQVWQFDPEAEARVPDGSGDNPINY